MGRFYLGELEELVLLAVAVLAHGAYGVTITEEIKQRANRVVSLSAVHISLYRLEEKGYLTSELGGATLTRGGRRKRLFSITSSGRQILSEMYQTRNEFWKAIPSSI